MRTPSALLPDRAPGGPVGLSVCWRTQGEYTVAALSGELDIACAATLREQLLGLLRPGSARIVIDLSGVRYCDASGLSVLVVTGRRAELLGGVLRLAAAAPAITSALRALGLHRRFDVFASVQAATAAALPGQPRRAAKAVAALPGQLRRPAEAAGPGAGRPARALHAAVSRHCAGHAVGIGELRAAVAALLSHADAWRDADPDRRFTPALQALSRAYARADNVLLTEAACTLLSVLTEHALSYSPSVAATASRLRRLLQVS